MTEFFFFLVNYPFNVPAIPCSPLFATTFRDQDKLNLKWDINRVFWRRTNCEDILSLCSPQTLFYIYHQNSHKINSLALINIFVFKISRLYCAMWSMLDFHLECVNQLMAYSIVVSAHISWNY